MGGLPESLRVFGGLEALDDVIDSLNAAVFIHPDTTHANAAAQPHAAS